MRNGLLLILSLWLPVSVFSFSPEKEIPSEAKEIYTATLKMRVQIYRIARDKVYEIYHPGFELLLPDLVEAIGMLEEQVSVLENHTDSYPFLDEAVNVWNNLRFHSMKKLEKKEFLKFYYDTRTVDNLLKITLDKLEEKYGFSGKKWKELRKRRELQSSVYKINIGYMTKKYAMSKSVENILDKEIPVIEQNTFGYAKKQGYFSNSELAGLLVMLMNDWRFLKYNFHNVFFQADRTVFAVSNSINRRIDWIIKRFVHEN